MQRVAMIGTGIMGAPMARHLRAAGYDVTVWNRTRAKAVALEDVGVTIADSPRAAAVGVEAIGICVTDDAAVSEVLEGPDGLLAGLEIGALVVDLSTTSVAAKQRFAERVRAHGGRPVDAPVFGTRPQAESGSLLPVVGAAEDDLAAARAFLDPFSAKVRHVGDIGAGTALKLAGNLLVYTMVNAIAESLALVESLGGDSDRLLEAIESTPINAPIFQYKGRAMLRSDYAPLASVSTARKDLSLILQAAAGAGVPLVAADAVRRAFDAAAAAGFAEEDMGAVFKMLR